MRRLRCGETSCVYHINGCTAGCVQVSAKQPTPCCTTYSPSDGARAGASFKPAPESFRSRFARTEFGDTEPVKRAELYTISCTAADCLRNHDCMCRAAWLEIGFPKEYDGLDVRCKSYVSSCGQGSLQNK